MSRIAYTPSTMAKTGGDSGLDASKFKPDSRGEVRIGAFERRQKRRRLLIGAVGVALIVAALGMYVKLRPHKDPGHPDHYPVMVSCDVCGHTKVIEVPFGQTFPIKCENCGGLAYRPLWRCRDCDALFAPDQLGTTIRCPDCGSLSVGSAAGP